MRNNCSPRNPLNEEGEAIWEKEWGGTVKWCHGKQNARGQFCLRKTLIVGRFMFIDILIKDVMYNMLSVRPDP